MDQLQSPALSEAANLFYQLTPQKILSAVERLGVRCTGRILQLNSLENRVYDVEIEHRESTPLYERSKVIKFFRPARWSAEQIAEEFDFQQQLLAAELPVVLPLKFSDGQYLQHIAADDGLTQICYVVYPKIGGRIKDEFNDHEIEQLGRLAARVHMVGRQYDFKHRLTLSPDTYGNKNLDYFYDEQTLPAEIEQQYLDRAEDIIRVTEDWFKSSELHRVHGDFHPGNILWQEQSVRIVDFDDALNGPAVQDLWLLTPGRSDWQLDQRELLIKSYEGMINFDPETLRLIEPLRALRLIHFSAWIARRWQDPIFRLTFTNFGTQDYWREQLQALEEVWQIMNTGSLI